MEKDKIIYYRKLVKEPRVFIPDLNVYAKLDLWSDRGRAFAAIKRQVGVYEYIDYEGYLEKWSMSPLNTELRFNEECFEDKKEYTAEEVYQILHPFIWFEPVGIKEDKDKEGNE